MIQTGQLDQRLDLLRPYVTGQDGTGADILGDPELVRNVWANVEYLSGKELTDAAQRWAEVRYKITIRRQPGITIALTDYISWKDQTLDMLDIRGQNTRDDFWIIIAQDHK